MDKDEQDIITFNRRFRRAGRICRVLWLINLVLLILIRCTKWQGGVLKQGQNPVIFQGDKENSRFSQFFLQK